MKNIIIFTKNGSVETTGHEEIIDWLKIKNYYLDSVILNDNNETLGYQITHEDIQINLLVLNLATWNNTNKDYYNRLTRLEFQNNENYLFSYHSIDSSRIIRMFFSLFNLQVRDYISISHGTLGHGDEREERKQYLSLVNRIDNNFPEALQNFWNYYQNRERKYILFNIKTNFLDYITSNNKFPESLPNELETALTMEIMNEWKGKNYDAADKNHVSIYYQLRDELNKLVSAKS